MTTTTSQENAEGVPHDPDAGDGRPRPAVDPGAPWVAALTGWPRENEREAAPEAPEATGATVEASVEVAVESPEAARDVEAERVAEENAEVAEVNEVAEVPSQHVHPREEAAVPATAEDEDEGEERAGGAKNTEAAAEADTEAEAEPEAESETESDHRTAPASGPVPTPTPAPHRGGVSAPVRYGRNAAAAGSGAPRWSPLIVGESTQEIPVHLLFRDETESSPAARRVSMPVPLSTRLTKPAAPAPAPAAVPVPSLSPSVRSGSRPAPRSAPPVDEKFAERPGPALPGWAAAVVGVCALLGCLTLLWWVGAVPDQLSEMLRVPSHPYRGIALGQWALLALGVMVLLFAVGGLGRGRVGHAWVLTLCGDYRGSVRRTGLLWVSPLLLRRRVDVRLRHWRSEPIPAVDAQGTALRVVVLVVWRVRDSARAVLGVPDHEEYLREQVEAAMARVVSQLPADAFHETAPTLRDAEAVGDALTRMLSAECRPVGLDIFSAQPTRIEYAPEIAEAMQRSQIAALDARHRDSVLSALVDAVDDTVHRLTSRGLVELDDYERKALVKDLTVAFYTGRPGGGARF